MGITLLSSTKQNIQVKNILEKLLYNKTVIAFNWKPFRVTWVTPRYFMGFVLIIFFIFLYHCLSLFVPFYWSFSAIVLSVILRITASEYHFGFCKLFGKKLLRAYVVLFYYVPNQNKVFLFLFLSYTMHRLKQHNIMQKYIIQLSKMVGKC